MNMKDNHMFKSIRTKIVLLVLGIFIPINLFTTLMSNAFIGNLESQIFDSKENALKIYRNQIEIYFNSMEQYLYGILTDSEWNSLNYDQQNENYIMTKIRLWNRLINNRDAYPLAGAFYVNIKNSGEILFAKNVNKLTVDEEEAIKVNLFDNRVQGVWDIFTCETGSYIKKSVSNQYMELGVLVKEEELLDLWEGEETDILLFLEGLTIQPGDIYEGAYFGLENESETFYVLYEPYNAESFTIVLLIPERIIKAGIPFVYRFVFILSIIGIIAVPIIYLILNKILLKPLRHIEDAILEIDKGNITYRIAKFEYSREFQDIAWAFNKMLDQIKNLRIKAYDLKIEKQRAQLDSLKLQINPHLLLNSLNTVYSLAQMKKYEGIQKFVINLVQYFRYSLRNTEEYVPLKSELDFINNYLEIQQMRYPDKFYVVYNIEEELMEERILPLIIENFVENSTKYALLEGRLIEIIITVKADGQFLRISVCDNGRGMEEEFLRKIRAEQMIEDSRGKHIGIYNCVKRLKLFYGQESSFSITSEIGAGTQVWIAIPRKEQQANESSDC